VRVVRRHLEIDRQFDAGGERVNRYRGRCFDRIGQCLHHHPAAGVATHCPCVQAIVEILLDVGGIEDRHHHRFEDVFGLVWQGGRLGGVVVAGNHQNATKPGRTSSVGVPEHVAAAVHTGPLAVPHGEDAIVLAPGKRLSCWVPQTAVAARSSLTAGWKTMRWASRCRLLPSRAPDRAPRGGCHGNQRQNQRYSARPLRRAGAAASAGRTRAWVPLRKTRPGRRRIATIERDREIAHRFSSLTVDADDRGPGGRASLPPASPPLLRPLAWAQVARWRRGRPSSGQRQDLARVERIVRSSAALMARITVKVPVADVVKPGYRTDTCAMS
jgi:hypothetical protein